MLELKNPKIAVPVVLFAGILWSFGPLVVRYMDNPNQVQRCQIVADRLFTSVHLGKKETAILMAAYILNQMPDVKTIDIDTTGNMEDTIFLKD